jgi:hypothetical protein
MSWFDLLGYAASLSVLATFYMSTMVPLRMMALGSNVLFASYGLLGHIYPVLILHVVLFPVNLYRLVQIHNLIRDVRSASSAGISIDALLPFMRRWVLHAGDILFRKGDAADRLYYVCTGAGGQRNRNVRRTGHCDWRNRHFCAGPEAHRHGRVPGGCGRLRAERQQDEGTLLSRPFVRLRRAAPNHLQVGEQSDEGRTCFCCGKREQRVGPRRVGGRAAMGGE